MINWLKRYPFHSSLLLCTLAYIGLLVYLANLYRSGVYGDLGWYYIPAAQSFLEGDWSGRGHISGLGPTHSLFIALVSLLFGVHLFLAAKIVTIIASLLSIWISYFLLCRAFGERIAFFGTLLYMGGSVILSEAWKGLPDPVFTLFTLAALFFLTKPERSRRHFLVAGLFAGIAFTVKLNGAILLLLGIGGELLLSPSRSGIRQRLMNILLFCLGFSIVGSVFLTYNGILMGSPLQTRYSSAVYVFDPSILPPGADPSKPVIATLIDNWSYILAKYPEQFVKQFTLLLNYNLLLHGFPIKWLDNFWKYLALFGLLTVFIRPTRLQLYLLAFNFLFFLSLTLVYPVPRYLLSVLPVIAVMPFVFFRWFATEAPADSSLPPSPDTPQRVWHILTIFIISSLLVFFIAWTYVQNLSWTKSDLESLEARMEFAPRVAAYLKSIEEQHLSDWAAIGTYYGGAGSYWISYYTGTLPLDIAPDLSHRTESGFKWDYESLLPRMAHLLYSDERKDTYQPDLALAEGLVPSLLEPIYQVNTPTNVVLYRVLESNLICPIEKLEVKSIDSPYDVQRLIDGKLSTGWFSAPTSSRTETQELLFDLGQAQSINRVLLVPWSSGYAFPEKFSLEASIDAQRWEPLTLTKVPQPPAPEAIPAFTFPTTQARYFKLLISQMPSAGALNVFRPVAHWPDPNEQLKMGSGTQVKTDCPGRSFNFTGVDSYAQIDDRPALKPKAFSISLWFKVNAFDGQLHTLIRQDQSEHYGYWLAWDNRGGRNHIWWEIGDGHDGVNGKPSHFHALVTPFELKVGEWVQVIATYDGKELKVFQNNKLIGSGVYAAATAYRSAPLFIGSTNTKGSYSFTGEIADTLVYDRVLTFNEIEELAALPRGACWLPLPSSTASQMYRFGLKEIRFSLATEKKRGLSKFTFAPSDISYDRSKNSLKVRLHNVGERESAAQVAFSIPARSLRSGQWTELGVVDSPVILPGQDGVVEFDLTKFNPSTLVKIAVTLDPYRAFTPRGETVWIELGK